MQIYMKINHFPIWKLCLGLICLCAVGCELEQTLNYDLPVTPARPYITCLWGPDKALEVYTGWTQPLVTASPQELDTVFVSLYKNGEKVEDLVPVDKHTWRLSKPISPQASADYQLRGSCKSCEEIYSDIETLPYVIPILDGQVQIDTLEEFGLTGIQFLLQMRFRDSIGGANYGGRFLFLDTDSLPLTFETSFDFPTRIPSRLAIDTLSQSQDYTVNFEPFRPFFRLDQTIGVRFYTYHLSDATEQILFSQDEFETTRSDYFYQPAYVFSNITHAEGFWGMYAIDSLDVYLK